MTEKIVPKKIFNSESILHMKPSTRWSSAKNMMKKYLRYFEIFKNNKFKIHTKNCWNFKPLISSVISMWSFLKYTRRPIKHVLATFLIIWFFHAFAKRNLTKKKILKNFISWDQKPTFSHLVNFGNCKFHDGKLSTNLYMWHWFVHFLWQVKQI